MANLGRQSGGLRAGHVKTFPQTAMRCLVHDFAGHPFPIHLSRELARRGHDVIHVYPLGLQGPKGRLDDSKTETGKLEIVAVPLSAGFRKYSPWRRFTAQRQYARDLKRILSGRHFDVMISGNTPIDVQAELLWHCRRNSIGFIHWVQDVYSHAIEFVLRRMVGGMAPALTFPFLKLDQSVARRADASVVIAPGFERILAEWGTPPERISVIENWAPLDEIRPLPRNNEWSARHGLDGKTVFLYSGTLGMKHRPDLLYTLAERLVADGDTSSRVVVISEGVGREYLEKKPALETLMLLDYQPYAQVPAALASADVLLATLEADASQFAVPSKILAYLCAGRPLLFAAPRVNFAASVVERSESGIVVDPGQPKEWVDAAKRLAGDANLRASLSANALRYAAREFDISRISARFEEVLITASNANGNNVRTGVAQAAAGARLSESDTAASGIETLR
jgi:colanic acid biosynthesis glycosyl transferase WcaI